MPGAGEGSRENIRRKAREKQKSPPSQTQDGGFVDGGGKKETQHNKE